VISPRPEILATQLAEHGGRMGLQRGAQTARLDFSVCLNAFGPAEIVARAVAESIIDEYPDPRSRAPRAAAAGRWDRPVAEIAFGAGAAELIHAACFAYLRPGDGVLIGAPAFGEYERAVRLCGAVPRKFDLNGSPSACERLCGEIASSRPRLTFLTTPMNPTGDSFALDDLRLVADVARASDCLLVVDQAYDAFAAAPLGTPALAGHAAVLHLRSMTKDHALAGVRVAFAVASPDVVDAIERARVPWAASNGAQAAGVATRSDAALLHVRDTTAILRQEATRVIGLLASRGITVRPTSTHFFLVRCQSARIARDRLLAEHGILVRDCTSFGLPEWIRVAARTPAQNDVLIHALDSVLT
jgi:histidinol-phosphate/aromatic aminotransferase/cobyric acid decarboxylase-like protein